MPRGVPKSGTRKPKKGTPKPKKGITENETVETKELSKEPEKVYNHVRYQRCDRKLDASQYPGFMKRNMTCSGLMKAVKTTDGGKYKHYKCPICETIKKVEGELV